jgi:hypothetical protein
MTILEIFLSISHLKSGPILNKICDQHFITEILLYFEKYSQNNILHNNLTKLIENLLTHFFEKIDQKMCEEQLNEFLSILYKSYYKKYITGGQNVTFKGSINEILIFLYEKMISIQIVFENQYWEKLRNEYAGKIY